MRFSGNSNFRFIPRFTASKNCQLLSLLSASAASSSPCAAAAAYLLVIMIAAAVLLALMTVHFMLYE
jgi:hypothetical protein